MGDEMTTPAERIRSVRGARQLLEILANHTGQFNHDLVRMLAIKLLRHFPSDADIAASNGSFATLAGTLHEEQSPVSVSVGDESVVKK